MKIQYASDLHLEFPDNSRWIEANPLKVNGDVLVLAGDIHVLGTIEMFAHPFFDWCESNYAATLIVPGNHEYYGAFDLAQTLDHWDLSVRPHVHVLNNHSVIIDDTEFFLTTLWSRIAPQDEMLVNKHLTDCYRMFYHGHPFKACHFGEVHDVCRQWLDDALRESTAKHRVVVTHHCPVLKEDPRYESNGLTWAFIVPMESYVEQCGADAWIFGHTHYNGARGMRLGGTTMCVNQLGYVKNGIEQGFELDAAIEL